jgi:hypothetical protein
VNSLSAHLVAGSRHGQLRFHPDCPFCRAHRLAGTLSDAVLPARAQAGLLAAALGAGGLFPGVAAAGGPAGSLPAPAHSSQAPVSDERAVGDETQEEPADEAPELRELLTDPDLGDDAGGDDVGAEDDDSEAGSVPSAIPPPAPVAEEALGAPVPEPGLPPQPAPADAPAPQPAAAEPPPAAEAHRPAVRDAPSRSSERRALKRARELRLRARRSVARAPAPVLSPAVVVARASASVPVEPVPVSRPAASAGNAIGGPSYVVEPGDSLWSIARRLLGTSASNGKIAREVARLWWLNEDGIGTSDPSLLHVGTELRLG